MCGFGSAVRQTVRLAKLRQSHRVPGDSPDMNPPIAASSTMLEEIVSEKRDPIPVYRVLTGFDRCDGDVAAAVAEITFASGTVHLCGHHTRLGMAKIRATAIELWIEPAELFESDRDLRAQMDALAAVHRPEVIKAAKKTDGFV